MRGRKGVDLDGGRGGENWEEKKKGNHNQDILYEIIRIYYVRKIYFR